MSNKQIAYINFIGRKINSLATNLNNLSKEYQEGIKIRSEMKKLVSDLSSCIIDISSFTDKLDDLTSEIKKQQELRDSYRWYNFSQKRAVSDRIDDLTARQLAYIGVIAEKTREHKLISGAFRRNRARLEENPRLNNLSLIEDSFRPLAEEYNRNIRIYNRSANTSYPLILLEPVAGQKINKVHLFLSDSEMENV